jgi:hypothetical protein
MIFLLILEYQIYAADSLNMLAFRDLGNNRMHFFVENLFVVLNNGQFCIGVTNFRRENTQIAKYGLIITVGDKNSSKK